MAQTAAHLVDHLFPPVRVRQWVLLVPKRLRRPLEREPRVVCALLHILLCAIEAHLRRNSGAASHVRLGAVSIIHRVGSLTPDAVAALAEQVRVRLLLWFAPTELIDPDDVREMLAREREKRFLPHCRRAPSGRSLEAVLRW
jgi:hypothetical protein